MEIRITGTEKELADFVLRIHNQQVLCPDSLDEMFNAFDEGIRSAMQSETIPHAQKPTHDTAQADLG